MPRGADPERVLAVGPSCFAGREEFFPDWETAFTFAPEPLADHEVAREAARAAQALAAEAIPRLAAWLSPHAGELPAAYWQTLLAPWAVDVARQVIERHLRARAMIAAWGELPLQVELLPADLAFHFQDEHDFTLRGALGTDFNHWLFSRLLEADWPGAWQRRSPAPEADDARKAKAADAGASPAQDGAPPLRRWLRRTARSLLLGLPFPRLKGMTLAQALRFSLALLHPCHGPDHSLDLAAAFGAGAHTETPRIPPLPLDPLPLFQAACPESLRALGHPRSLSRTSRPRLRVATILAYEDAAYRERLARWRGRGHRLAFAQHGGNYGMEAVACETAFVEYSQDVFFTWGWTRHGEARGNFVPLPSPQLARLEDAWRGADGENLLFVGTEMAAFAYRLDSHPTPLQLVEYREDKEWFFEALGRELQARTLYRPYFPLPGCLEDAAWLLPRMPRLKLCTGPLLPHLLGCRLLVLDHHGTSLLEAMAANVPMVLYWNRAHWPLTPDGEALLDGLAAAGIWFPTAEEAAVQARRIWPAAADWWQSPDIQGARRRFCEAQARLSHGKEVPLWMQTLKAL
ncbi:MAG: LIC12162 family protein [Desulfovibrio sp.]|nr:LIC12162 family protein [Desulfovibrio sp.]